MTKIRNKSSLKIQILTWFTKRRLELGILPSPLTANQRARLEEVFELLDSNYPSPVQYKELENELELPYKRINNWFMYRRRKLGLTEGLAKNAG